MWEFCKSLEYGYGWISIADCVGDFFSFSFFWKSAINWCVQFILLNGSVEHGLWNFLPWLTFATQLYRLKWSPIGRFTGSLVFHKAHSYVVSELNAVQSRSPMKNEKLIKWNEANKQCARIDTKIFKMKLKKREIGWSAKLTICFGIS